MKLHLIDGTYELFRNFYGPPKRQAPDGREVGAVWGMLNSLIPMLAQESVTHVGVAFDTVIESFRNRLFVGYKTGDGIDPELFQQFPLAEEATRALGLVTWSMREFEADDALFAAACRFKDRVEQVVICTPDKDLGQAVEGERVVQLDRRRKRTITEAGVMEQFGVPPAAIPDYLALVGDSADGIPGIPRWGKKSAATVLERYGSLEGIPLDVAEWDIKVRGAATLCGNLAQQWEQALLYRRLAILRADVPLPQETVGAMAWSGAGPEFKGLCERLGATDLLERVPLWREPTGLDRNRT